MPRIPDGQRQAEKTADRRFTLRDLEFKGNLIESPLENVCYVRALDLLPCPVQRLCSQLLVKIIWMKLQAVFQRLDSFYVTAVSVCRLEFDHPILAERHMIGASGHKFNDSNVEGHRRRGRGFGQPDLTSRKFALTLKCPTEIDEHAAGIICPSRSQNLLPFSRVT